LCKHPRMEIKQGIVRTPGVKGKPATRERKKEKTNISPLGKQPK